MAETRFPFPKTACSLTAQVYPTDSSSHGSIDPEELPAPRVTRENLFRRSHAREENIGLKLVSEASAVRQTVQP
jgi:hypothetical protein